MSALSSITGNQSLMFMNWMVAVVLVFAHQISEIHPVHLIDFSKFSFSVIGREALPLHYIGVESIPTIQRFDSVKQRETEPPLALKTDCVVLSASACVRMATSCRASSTICCGVLVQQSGR